MSHTSSQAVTARIAKRLAGHVGRHRFSMWFDHTARLQYHGADRRLDVAVPNRIIADWIDRNFRDQLCQAATEEVGGQVALALRIDPASFPEKMAALPADALPAVAAAEPIAPSGPRRSAGRTRRAPQREHDRQLRYSLDDFIVGPTNELAFSAACQLVEDQHTTVNPLFIHGGVGLGKTHLLQGICRKFQASHPDARIHYTTGEKFTNDYLASMGNRTQDQFRQRIRRLDLLAIDDVHFLAGKDKTQQEFLHSFDEIDLSGARVAMASDNPPKQIKQFSAALVSRCVRGLVVEVKPPDTATRVKIVKALAQRRGMTLLESVLAVLASRCTGSVREIEGTLAKLHALANLKQGRGGEEAACEDGESGNGTIGHALVNRLLESQSEPVRKRISFDHILDVVCVQLHVSRQQILSSHRLRPVVLARSLAIYLARQMTRMSYPEISVAINKSSHSTIIAADRRIADQVQENEPVAIGFGSELDQLPLAQLVDRLKQLIAKA